MHGWRFSGCEYFMMPPIAVRAQDNSGQALF